MTLPHRHSPLSLGRAIVCSAFGAWLVVAAQPTAQAPVQGAHARAKDPKGFTDDVDLTVPGTPIDHPARVYPATNDFPTGPAIGERLPDFRLANQRGEVVDFHADRGRGKAIVSFQRSAVW